MSCLRFKLFELYIIFSRSKIAKNKMFYLTYLLRSYFSFIFISLTKYNFLKSRAKKISMEE